LFVTDDTRDQVQPMSGRGGSDLAALTAVAAGSVGRRELPFDGQAHGPHAFLRGPRSLGVSEDGARARV
jgi:hypothetical protein